MKRSEYVNLIKKDKNINFIGTVNTPWHVLGLESLINRLENKGIKLRGYIFICSFEYKKDGISHYVSDKNFSYKNKNIKKIYTYYEGRNNINKINTIKSIRNYLKNKNKYKEDIYIANCSNPDWSWIDIIQKAHLDKLINYLVYDEGIGTINLRSILGMYDKRIVFMPNKKNSLIERAKAYVEAIVEYNINNYLENKFLLDNAFINHNLFRKDNNCIIVNEKAKKYYINVLKRQAKKIKDDDHYANALLINTQLAFEDSIEEKYIYKLIDIAKKNNRKVVIKPHPRDTNIKRLKKYHCYIDTRKEISQEVIIASLKQKPLCCVGVGSTTLITLKMFYDMPTICLSKLAYSYYQDKTTDKKLFENFINDYENYINMPKTENELMYEVEKKLK